MAVFISILEALSALPKIGALIEKAVSAIIAWHISKQKAETLAMIADAAALSARAQTQDERFHAIEKWKEALSRSRFID